MTKSSSSLSRQLHFFACAQLDSISSVSTVSLCRFQSSRKARHSTTSGQNFSIRPEDNTLLVIENKPTKSQRKRSNTPIDSSGISLGSTDSGLNSTEALAPSSCSTSIMFEAAKNKAKLGLQRKARAPTNNLISVQQDSASELRFASRKCIHRSTLDFIHKVIESALPSFGLELPMAHGTPIPAILRKNLNPVSMPPAQMSLLASQIRQKANQRNSIVKRPSPSSTAQSQANLTDSSIGSVYMHNLSRIDKVADSCDLDKLVEYQSQAPLPKPRKSPKKPSLANPTNILLRKNSKDTNDTLMLPSPSQAVTFRVGTSSDMQQKVASWKSDKRDFAPTKLKRVETEPKKEKVEETEESSMCPQLLGLKNQLRRVNVVQPKEEPIRPKSMFVPESISLKKVELRRVGNEENVPIERAQTVSLNEGKKLSLSSSTRPLKSNGPFSRRISVVESNTNSSTEPVTKPQRSVASLLKNFQ
ncbi:hypothetical protein Ciccas_007996 [Cichlidogyrus casuarinus]|uniref:Uncharacterized protein n=1 Tax=Cichlidogyrus casuarinus TaxID=1844966 RepID=A0ABD2Q197_9PLAT